MQSAQYQRHPTEIKIYKIDKRNDKIAISRKSVTMLKIINNVHYLTSDKKNLIKEMPQTLSIEWLMRVFLTDQKIFTIKGAKNRQNRKLKFYAYSNINKI